MKLVSIVTVNFNQPLVTEEFLHSVANSNDYPAIEVIVVDNGSSVDHTSEWQGRFTGITFIRSERNLGFAGGNNLGIGRAKGEYYFLINNDTELTPGVIGALVDTLEKRPEVGMVSPKIMYASDRSLIQYAGYTPMNFLTGRNRCIGQFEIDAGQYDQASGITGYVHGAAMLVRKEAIVKAGLMDTNYFLYYEELDWCEKFKRAGYLMYVNTSVRIYHKESVSVGKRSALKEYFMTRNRILFLRKNAPAVYFLAFSIYFTLLVVPRNLLVYLKNREYTFVRVFRKAIQWNFTHNSSSPDLGYPL